MYHVLTCWLLLGLSMASTAATSWLQTASASEVAMVKPYPLLSFGFDEGDGHRFGKRLQKISQKQIETRRRLRRRCFAFCFASLRCCAWRGRKQGSWKGVFKSAEYVFPWMLTFDPSSYASYMVHCFALNSNLNKINGVSYLTSE